MAVSTVRQHKESEVGWGFGFGCVAQRDGDPVSSRDRNRRPFRSIPKAREKDVQNGPSGHAFSLVPVSWLSILVSPNTTQTWDPRGRLVRFACKRAICHHSHDDGASGKGATPAAWASVVAASRYERVETTKKSGREAVRRTVAPTSRLSQRGNVLPLSLAVLGDGCRQARWSVRLRSGARVVPGAQTIGALLL